MAKVGRNDPCPCGSGKKYKKCCGKNNVVSLHQLIEKDVHELTQKIITYAFEKHHESFTDLLDEHFDKYDIPDDAADLFAFFVGNWLIFSTPIEKGRTIISYYIEENRDKVTRPLLKESLLHWEKARPTVARIQQINRSDEIILQPIDSHELFTVQIFEKDRQLEEDSLVIGILVPLGDAFTFFTTFIDLTDEAEEVIDAIEEMADESDEENIEAFIANQFPDILNVVMFGDDADLLTDFAVADLQWESPQHLFIAERFQQEMTANGMPKQAAVFGVVLWHEFCAIREPIIKKPNLYLAALHYLVIEELSLPFAVVTQKELADDYNVSQSSLSAKYREMADVLADVLDDLYAHLNEEEEEMIDHPFPQFATEQALRDVERALENMDFESEEEANDFINQVLNDNSHRNVPLSKQDEAQELLYRAYETSGKEKVKLAKKALRLYPNSPDAYVILGEEALKKGNVSKALSMFQKGMDVGRKDLGNDFFEENSGHFWGIVSTRPFMRAKLSYAYLLYELGETDKAIEQFEELLALNENDNQGVRYQLFVAYAENDDLTKAKQLLNEYDEPSVNNQYNRLFVELSECGLSKRAKRLFQHAHDDNPYVISYLLNEKKLPHDVPATYSLGSEEEAVLYASEHLDLWESLK